MLAATAAATHRRRGRGASLAVLAGLVVFGAAATSAAVRVERVSHNPLTHLAATRSGATLTGVVVDPGRGRP
jgi:hypothetical protein